MDQFRVTFLPNDLTVTVPAGMTLLRAQIDAGLSPDAPCAGHGLCGKCRVTVDGREILACQTAVDRDMTVHTAPEQTLSAPDREPAVPVIPDGTDDYVLACDVGTTTVAVYLLDGRTGALLARQSAVNPQCAFGADVISRIPVGTKITVIRQTEIVDGDIAEFLPFMEDKTNVIYLHPEAHAASNDGGDNE